VKAGVALCRHCGAILDADRAARFGVAASRKNPVAQHSAPAANRRPGDV